MKHTKIVDFPYLHMFTKVLIQWDIIMMDSIVSKSLSSIFTVLDSIFITKFIKNTELISYVALPFITVQM